jgi:hypothetical protein
MSAFNLSDTSKVQYKNVGDMCRVNARFMFYSQYSHKEINKMYFKSADFQAF